MSYRIREGLALFVILFAVIVGSSPKAYALGECGLSCCVAGAFASGSTLAQNFGLTLQYEATEMQTIREGTGRITPDKVLDNKASEWPAAPAQAKEFTVPTEMRMEKRSLLAAYPATERIQLLGIIPWVRNEMDMRMIIRSTSGSTSKMNHAMDDVSGLGDITLMALYTAYTDAPIRPEQRLTLGLGIKTPTGKNNEKTSSGDYAHVMMQAGTGSWDPLLVVNYMRAFYPIVFQTSLIYQYATEGDEGYEFGDQVTLDLIMRDQVANYINLGLEVNGLYAGKDADHDGKYSNPETSILDNVANTGITAIYFSPTVQVKIPQTPVSMDIKYQMPVYQDANGVQQVVDSRWLLAISAAF